MTILLQTTKCVATGEPNPTCFTGFVLAHDNDGERVRVSAGFKDSETADEHERLHGDWLKSKNPELGYRGEWLEEYGCETYQESWDDEYV